MSLRVAACFLFVLGFSIYAWRNWFVSLCAAILLMAVLEHPDMPHAIAGIVGLNPWNILMANVLLAWASQRRGQGLVWDLPRSAAWLLAAYLGVIFWATFRLLFWTRAGYGAAYTNTYIVSEHIINCVKWLLPGLLLYDGCRSRKHVQVAVAVVLLLYVLLAVQVIKNVPLSCALETGDRLSRVASKNIQSNVGYNRVTLSNMLGGASWAVLGSYVLFRKPIYRLGVLGLAGVVSLGQALTGGRTGYASWAAVGVILCLIRWRWMLPIMAGTAIGVLTFLPGVRERLFEGFGGQQGAIVVQHDDYEITSGRTTAWPYVIKKIKENPIFGFGREAMVTTGIADFLMAEFGESFPHPHNAYLQVLLDSGIIGLVPVMAFYLFVLARGFRLLLDRQDPLYAAVGNMACALVLTLLVGSMGGQTFYPREGSMGMWCAIFLAFRLWVERQHSLETGQPLFRETAAPEPECEPEQAYQAARGG
jgi:O-antigen ligase